MRIRLSLVGGVPGDFVFGVEGGTFGRSMKCQWVLPDEERILSAVHGRVVFENNKFMLIDESTNGIFLEGRQQPIGRGNGVALTNGLRFSAARHVIEAQILPAQNANAFAMPAAPSPPMMQGYQSGWQAGTPSAEQALRERSDMGDMWAKNSQDPLVYLDGAPAVELTRLGGLGLGPSAAPMANALPSGPAPVGNSLDSLFAPAPQYQQTSFAGPGPTNPGPSASALQIPANFLAMPNPLGMSPAQTFQPQPLQNQPLQPQQPPFQPPLPQSPLMQPAGLSPSAEPLPSAPIAPMPPIAPSSPPIPQLAPIFAPVPSAPSPKLIPDDFDPLSILAAPIKRSSEARQEAIGNPPFLAQPSAVPVMPLAAQPVTPIPAAPIPVMPVPAVPIFPAPNGALIPQFPLSPAAIPLAQPPIPPAPIAPASMPPIPTAPVREPLSPSLMADIARIGEPIVSRSPVPELGAGDFDAIAAMKARREERKAKLVAKASGDVGQPLLPGAAPMPSAPLSQPPIPPLPLTPQALPPSATPIPAAASLASPMPIAPPAMANNAALIALFAGMGLQGADTAADRQEQMMRDVGEMIRAFSEGLILLLSARRMVKSEFRMDETQIQPEENNPFKHFKMAELALDELFVTRSGGFQAPAEAAGSALEDLKQHVMLTMSAMQRAIKLLMERLSPENVANDHETEGASRIRGLVSRKGKWETYVETHQRMSGNFDGIARQLIAEAFAQVQEEQARRIASQYWEKKK